MIITCITIGEIQNDVFPMADFRVVVNMGAEPERYPLVNNLEYMRMRLAKLKDEPMFSPTNKCYIAMVPGPQATAILAGLIYAFGVFQNTPDIWVQDPYRRSGDWIVSSAFIGEGLDWAHTWRVDSNLPNFAEYVIQQNS